MFELDKWEYINNNYTYNISYLQSSADADNLIKEYLDYIKSIGFTRIISDDELKYFYSLITNLGDADKKNKVNFLCSILEKRKFNIRKLLDGQWVIIKTDDKGKIDFIGIYSSLKEAFKNLLSKLDFYDSDFYDHLNVNAEKKASVTRSICSFYDEYLISDIESYIRKQIDPSFEYDAETEDRINHRDIEIMANNFSNLILEIKCKILDLANSGYITNSDYYPGDYGDWYHYILNANISPYEKESQIVLEEIKNQFADIKGPRKKHM